MKSRDKILKLLGNGEFWSVGEIYQNSSLSKRQINIVLLNLLAERKVIKIQAKPVNGYGLKDLNNESYRFPNCTTSA